MLDNTTDALIHDIKRMGTIPSSQNLYTDQDFIDACNDFQRSKLIGEIMKVREEFFVSQVNVPLIHGQRDYDVPERAVGNKIRQIILIDLQGNEVRLPRIEPENATWHENFMWWPGTKSGYLFENNQIHLTPNLDNTYTAIRMMYFRRPNRLTLTSNAGHVTSCNVVTGVIGLDKIPAGWVAGRIVDIIQERSPFRSRLDSYAILAVDPVLKTITVDPTVASGTEPINPLARAGQVAPGPITIGDWICDEGETTIPQYPEEIHPMLSNFVLIDVLKHLGDTQGANDASQTVADMLNDLHTIISNRDEGSPRKVFSRRGIWDTGGV